MQRAVTAMTRAAVHWQTLACVFGFAVILTGMYWAAATMQGAFFVGDIYRLGYPARLVYAEALRDGRIPLWTPDAMAGYPLFAEGQTGAYYPLNLLLYGLLPLPVALNYSVLLALWMVGAGTLLYARTLGLRRGPALLAGCTFMLGGFVTGRVNHLNMLSAVSLLPLLLWAVERATRGESWRWWAVVAGIYGLQGLAGHPQVSFLSGTLAALAAVAGPLGGTPTRWTVRRQGSHLVSCALALMGGALLALVQWAPTLELTRLSQRGQGLDSEFFTSFSLNPLQYAMMLWPFIRGNPYPLTSLETIGYVGALPLVFAALAPFLRRNRLVAFWVAVAILAFLLTLGHWNPAYRVLVHVPVINYFRAPARYLLWLNLAVALLAGVTAESLLDWTREGRRTWLGWAVVGVVPVVLTSAWVLRTPLDGLVESWRWLPSVWLGATLLLLAGLRWRPPRGAWLAIVIGLVLADLAAFNAVYNRTYNATMTIDEFAREPEALRFLQADAGGELYRVYTHEEIVPVLPVMRESLYPNIQLLHGVHSLNGYFPLVPRTQQWLASHLDHQLVDLLNVRYVLIPQLLPVDEATEAYSTANPFAPSIVGRTVQFEPQRVAAVEVEGYLSHSAELPDGAPVAELVLGSPDGTQEVWTLRSGNDLAEWAHSRDDVRGIVRHRLPSDIARTWPGRSGFPPRDHTSQTALARWAPSRPLLVSHIEVRPLIPRAFIRIERVRLIDPEGKPQLLSALIDEGDHVLVYRCPDVAIFRNERAGPRAFLVHRTRIAQSEAEAEELTAAPAFEPHKEVVLTRGRELDGVSSPGDMVQVEVYDAEYVRLRVVTAQDAYLVLADSYYPGWTARLDGRRVEIERANVALRAVPVPAGEHLVEFSFSPSSWRLGLVSSLAAWLALAGVLLLCRR